MSEHKTIDDLRTVLFETIEGVKSGELDIDRARCVSDLAQVMVNSAKVEVENAKATGKSNSGFLEPKSVMSNGITGTIVHKIR